MKTEDAFDFSKMRRPLTVMVIFWGIAVVIWQITGKIFFLYNFVYIGAALGVGMGVYAALPKRQKLWGRRLAQFLVGSYMLVFLGLFQHENMQIEGFFLLPFVGFLCRVSHSLSVGKDSGSPDIQSGMVRLGLLDGNGPGFAAL